MTLNPYLTFKDNCRDAFEFYRSVFGGEFDMVSTFREGPPDMGVPDDELDRVMHVSYPIGSSVLMGSDSVSGFGPGHTVGTNFSLSFEANDKLHADEVFAKLSEGGTVTMPLDTMFWCAYFGSLTDKFGINWQVVTEPGSE